MKMIHWVRALCLILSLPLVVHGQGAASADPPPIQDNSFLVEEAYNQEKDVVQHISAFTRQRTGEWAFTFTQEWPVTGQTHQFSYTLPFEKIGSGRSAERGIGDVGLNYRYQVPVSEERLAVAPRASLLLPTGDSARGLGSGNPGFQFNLPMSVTLSPQWVTHWNAGFTVTPSARNEQGDEAKATGYHAAGSVIWTARPTFNAMLEWAWQSDAAVVGKGETEREHGAWISPGVRWAHNFESGLQIVPGLAIPIGVGPNSGDAGVLIYLSFEHPF